MPETIQKFREELQSLLDRYKTKLTVPRIMHVAQDVFHKTLSIKYHPELHTAAINFLQSTGYTKPDFNGKWKSLDALQNEQLSKAVVKTLATEISKQCDAAPEHVIDAQDYAFKRHCSAQEIAEADCDGDIRHCKSVCSKRKPMLKGE